MSPYLTVETRETESLRRLVAEQDETIQRLRASLERAVRDIRRVGAHSASPVGCPICDLVRSYGYEPEDLRT